MSPARSICLVALVLAPSALAQDGAWERYDDRSGVVSYRRAMADSKLLATRGVSTVSSHIARLLGVYLDATKATSWVNLLVQLDERKIPGGHDAIERQIYDMPWPVADREFVFKRTVTWDAAHKTVTVTYNSVDDARFPITDDYVRAIDHGSYFRFTTQPDGGTEIEAVAMVDPMGSLPAWLFNSVQRAWPRESILALVTAAAQPDVTPFAEVASWGRPQAPAPAAPAPEAPPTEASPAPKAPAEAPTP